MSDSVKCALWLLPLLLLAQGCTHKDQSAQTQTLAPPIVDTPPPSVPAPVSTADLPPPVVGANPQPAPPADTKANTDTQPQKPVRKPRKPVAPVAGASPTPTPTQDAAAAQPSSVSAIGQLSEGGSGSTRSQTEADINATEKGVNGITRNLSDTEKKTAAQIHEFIRQARQALDTGDADGAHTLVMKAKVLLAELNP